jgi:hypothetical protein
MLFSQRRKLEEEYYRWIEKTNKKKGVIIKDCPFNVIAFLEIQGYLKKEEKGVKGFQFNKGDTILIKLSPELECFHEVIEHKKMYLGYSVYLLAGGSIGNITSISPIGEVFIKLSTNLFLVDNIFIYFTGSIFYIDVDKPDGKE